MNKSTLEQMKQKDSMVKRHVNMQDSEITKLKQKLSDQEKQIKSLREELQVISKIPNSCLFF
jgi:predicted RNase H-like nuclease (RuvC/YqgF family)